MKNWMLAFAVMLAACGGAKGPSKGSTAKTAAAAKESSAKAGSQATANTSKATMSGTGRDGVTCDASIEGVGFCASDAEIVFCSGGNWWVLDCSAIDPDAFCGTDETGLVDCWVQVQ